LCDADDGCEDEAGESARRIEFMVGPLFKTTVGQTVMV